MKRMRMKPLPNPFLTFLLLWGLVVLGFSFSCKRTPPEVLYVNSYHHGYPPSDAIMKGIREGLPGGDYALQVIYLDSKRHPSPEVAERIADSLCHMMMEHPPDAVIVSDDNAVRYLVEPCLNLTPIPVVFCGVNWSAAHYGLDRSHITGMLEVLPLRECLSLLKTEFGNPGTITVLSENSLSEQSNTLLLDTLYRHAGLEPAYELVNTFEDWKKAFLKANETSDAIYLPTNGAIRGWNEEEAKIFVEQHMRRPVFTCDDFMMKYCLFGLTKVPREQGDWAAESVRMILAGRSPADIPVARNRKTEAYYNSRLAKASGLMLNSEWAREAINVTD